MRQVALVAALLVPFGLLHAFVLAEICIGLVGVLFLARSALTGDWGWTKHLWLRVALVWWVWLVLCSTPLPLPGFGVAGWHQGFAQAFVIIRLILFTAALQSWLLTTTGARRAAWVMLALSCVWIGLESWQQYLTGKNIFGDPRWGDGSLTGPFWKPRAGALYSHLLFIAMLPAAAALLARPGWRGRAGGLALALLGVVTSVLIGQRMGVALTGLGLFVTAICMPRLRLPAVACAAVAVAVLVATPIISPATHSKLVGETQHNFHHFSQSPYGEIYTRSTVMGLQSPWHGWGYNGYRVDCPLPRFDGGLPALGIPPTSLQLLACIQHPQNFYVQAFVDSGFPGLILFIALVLVWTRDLGRGLLRIPDPLRVGLFIGVLNYTWPIASTDEFPTMYMLGWMFFFLGFGLACANIATTKESKDA
jgi:hypothetical protein